MTSARIVEAVLILAPLALGLPIGAYLRLRRHIYRAPGPIVSFRNLRWNSFLIAMGGVFMVRGAGGAFSLGHVAQICGLVLALQFFYVAYVNLLVAMSSGGLLIGMRFCPWSRFSGHTWLRGEDLELVSHSRRRCRLRVPGHMRADVQKIVELNILK